MARKPHHEEHPDERWLISYADMVTLLFALFIVMYSISSVNISKFEALRDGLSSAFSSANLTGGQSVLPQLQTTDPAPITPTAPSITPDFSKTGGSQAGADDRQREAAARRETEQLKAAKAKIDAAARAAGLSSAVKTEINERGLAVRLLTDDVIFPSGSAALSGQANTILSPVASALASLPNPIRVEGHTDSRPINTPQFPSNWELAASRAGAVVRDFTQLGIPASRLQATGFADTRPIGSNSTDDGRAQNRRVEVLVLRQLGRD